MLIPHLYKNLYPLLYQNSRLLAAKGNTIYALTEDLSLNTVVGSEKSGALDNLIAKQPILSRALRLGFHGLAVNEHDDMVGVMKGRLVFKGKNEPQFKPVFRDFRGSRPLNIIYGNNKFLFGEYFGNPERGQVHIFASQNGRDWDRIYTFQEGAVRHVHGVLDDPFRKGFWVLTGDSDEESALWYTDDNFATLTKVVHGSQKARAVNIIVLQDSLIIPMDSPLEQNYIQRYHIATDRLESVAAIPGSAFHAIESDGIMLVSTVTEPSTVNKTDAATLWGSLDGIHWKCVCELQRDIFPVKWQHVFRYAEIVLTPGINETQYITAYGRALKGYDNSLLAWRKDDLRAYLSD